MVYRCCSFLAVVVGMSFLAVVVGIVVACVVFEMLCLCVSVRCCCSSLSLSHFLYSLTLTISLALGVVSFFLFFSIYDHMNLLPISTCLTYFAAG